MLHRVINQSVLSARGHEVGIQVWQRVMYMYLEVIITKIPSRDRPAICCPASNIYMVGMEAGGWPLGKRGQICVNWNINIHEGRDNRDLLYQSTTGAETPSPGLLERLREGACQQGQFKYHKVQSLQAGRPCAGVASVHAQSEEPHQQHILPRLPSH